ncbi:MAG: low molecular weight phosphatase family protein [Pseudomonadota bacterium]
MRKTPSSILFACNMNSVRSPMAEALARHILPEAIHVDSCGVYKGALDPFVKTALEHAGIAPPPLGPREFGEVNVSDYDVIVALTPEAAAEARRLHDNVEFWEVENPTDTRGSEQDLHAAYGRLCSALQKHIRERFISE